MSQFQDNQRIPADKWDSYMMDLKRMLKSNDIQDPYLRQLHSYYYNFKQNNYELFKSATVGQMKDIDKKVIAMFFDNRRIVDNKYFNRQDILDKIKYEIKSVTDSVVSPISISIAQPAKSYANANQSKHPLDRKSSTKSVMAAFIVAVIMMIAGVTLMLLNLIGKVGGDTKLYIGMGLFVTSLVSLGVAAFQSRKKQN